MHLHMHATKGNRWVVERGSGLVENVRTIIILVGQPATGSFLGEGKHAGDLHLLPALSLPTSLIPSTQLPTASHSHALTSTHHPSIHTYTHTHTLTYIQVSPSSLSPPSHYYHLHLALFVFLTLFPTFRCDSHFYHLSTLSTLYIILSIGRPWIQPCAAQA